VSCLSVELHPMPLSCWDICKHGYCESHSCVNSAYKLLSHTGDVCGPEYVSQYSDSLRVGWSRDPAPVWVRFSAPVQIGSEVHPASYTMGTGSFPMVKRPGRGVEHPPQSSAHYGAHFQHCRDIELIEVFFPPIFRSTISSPVLSKVYNWTSSKHVPT